MIVRVGNTWMTWSYLLILYLVMAYTRLPQHFKLSRESLLDTEKTYIYRFVYMIIKKLIIFGVPISFKRIPSGHTLSFWLSKLIYCSMAFLDKWDWEQDTAIFLHGHVMVWGAAILVIFPADIKFTECTVLINHQLIYSIRLWL